MIDVEEEIYINRKHKEIDFINIKEQINKTDKIARGSKLLEDFNNIQKELLKLAEEREIITYYTEIGYFNFEEVINKFLEDYAKLLEKKYNIGKQNSWCGDASFRRAINSLRQFIKSFEKGKNSRENENSKYSW